MESKAASNRDAQIHLYLNTIHSSQVWNQPRSSSTDELVMIMWSKNTIEFSSVEKKTGMILFAGK